MKFDLQPYKLFTKKDVGVFIKQNLRGSFTWNGYVKKKTTNLILSLGTRDLSIFYKYL